MIAIVPSQLGKLQQIKNRISNVLAENSNDSAPPIFSSLSPANRHL